MGQGAKTSSGTSSTSSPYADILAGMGKQMWSMAKPVAQTYSSQAAEALRTGGVNAQIPSINASVSASREAASQTQQQLRQRLAEGGLAGTPFADALLAQEEGTANQGIANIPATEAMAFAQSAVPNVLNMAGQGMSALGTAAGINKKTTTTSTPSQWDQFMQASSFAMYGPPGPFNPSGNTTSPPAGAPVSSADAATAASNPALAGTDFSGATYGASGSSNLWSSLMSMFAA